MGHNARPKRINFRTVVSVFLQGYHPTSNDQTHREGYLYQCCVQVDAQQAATRATALDSTN